MWLLVATAVNISSEANQRVHSDVMNSSSKMEFKIFAFIAEELTVVYNNANFFWKPTRGRPEQLRIRAVCSCIKHEYSRGAMNCFFGGQRLVLHAPATPASTRCLSFHTRLQNLREREFGTSRIPGSNFLIILVSLHYEEYHETYRWWIHEFVYKCCPGSCMFTATVFASNSSSR